MFGFSKLKRFAAASKLQFFGVLCLAVALTVPAAAQGRVLYVGNQDDVVEFQGVKELLESAGLTVERASTVTASLEGYDAVVLINGGVAEENRRELMPSLEAYIARGGGVVLAWGVPWNLTGKAIYGQDNMFGTSHDNPGDLSAISNWFGASGFLSYMRYDRTRHNWYFLNDGAMSASAGRIAGTAPSVKPGDQLVLRKGEKQSPGVFARSLSPNAVVEAKWNASERVSAISHTYGDGRVYYQAVPYSPNDQKLNQFFLAGVLWAMGNDKEKPWLGMDVYGVGQGVEYRVVIADVLSQGPVAKAGLLPGDIIQKFAGRKLHSVSDLNAALQETEAGESVQVNILRGGEQIRIDLLVGNGNDRPQTTRY